MPIEYGDGEEFSGVSGTTLKTHCTCEDLFFRRRGIFTHGVVNGEYPESLSSCSGQ